MLKMTKKELNKLRSKLEQRPTINSNYTKNNLKEYAHKRAMIELATIDFLSGKEEPTESEEYREPLAITESKVFTIELSTGGDADGFKLTYIGTDLISGYYYWADWGVYEEVELKAEELDKVASFYGIYP